METKMRDEQRFALDEFRKELMENADAFIARIVANPGDFAFDSSDLHDTFWDNRNGFDD